ncbi:MAG: hypothetical protein ACRDRJ_00740 [Streptosporangiaceae bacterium]
MPQQQTRAEIQARRIGEGFERAGYTVEYVIEHHEAEYFSDGGVMFAPRATVHVHVLRKVTFGDSWSFGFVTWHKAKGHRTSTRYVSGTRTRGLKPRRGKRDKQLSLKALRSDMSIERDIAHYEARKPAEEGT